MPNRGLSRLLGDENHGWWHWVILLGIATGLLLIVVWAASTEDPLRSLGVALIVTASAFAVSGLVGFLFGIPRVVQPEGTSGGSPLPTRDSTEYRVNTSLEQISDWLTKIIVGLGLVELRQIGPAFVRLSEFLATAFGDPGTSSSLVAAAIAYLGTVGFLSGYLWSRIYLPVEFSRAEQAAKRSPAYLEGLVHALLYQPAPAGFERAIEEGKRYIKRFGDGAYRIWQYLASAYGQQYSYLRATAPDKQKEMEESEKKALEALDNVMRLNKSELRAMRSLWDGTGSEQENDLTVFKNRQRFKTLFDSAEPGKRKNQSS